MLALTTSIDDRFHAISNRLINLSLNIHIELTDGHCSLSRSNEIRKYSDQNLISSSTSNPFIDELLECIEYYCHEVTKLGNELRLMTKNSNEVLDDLSRGSQLCFDVLHNYHSDRNQAVQSILINPFREDAWYVVYEIDWNIFMKSRIILIRLRIYFLLMYQILINDTQNRNSSFHSLINKKTSKIDKF
jgi:hypothetical protein